VVVQTKVVVRKQKWVRNLTLFPVKDARRRVVEKVKFSSSKREENTA